MKKTSTIYKQAMRILLYCLLVAVSSCKDDNPTQPSDNPPTPTPPGLSCKITLAYQYLDVSYEATEEEVRFDATDNWEIMRLPEWVSATPKAGAEGKDISLTLSIEENPEYSERTGDVILTTIDGQDADTLTIRQFGISTYVPIDYEENVLTDFNPATGSVILECGNQRPTVRAGASIVIPTDSVSYIRIVKQVSENGNKLTLQTEEGDMTDVFINQEFTLSTAPAARAIVTRHGGVRATDAEGVIHPVKITASMPDGSIRTLYDLKAKAATRSTGDIINAGDSHPFFDKEYNADGKTIADWGNARLEWEKCNHHLNVTGRFHFTFGMDTEMSEDGTISVPRGDLLGFWCYVDGSASAEMILKLIAEAEFSRSVEETVLKDLLTAKGYTFTFMVGYVPVTVNVNADILLDAALSADAEAVLTAGMSANMDVQGGFSYVQGSTRLEPIWQAPNPVFTLHKPELTAKANIDAHASLYPKMRIRFFNFAGPDIAIKPYLLEHLEFDGRAGMEGENHAKWSSRLYYRTDMEANLALNFIGQEWSSATLTVATPEQDLHRTPDKIELVSPANGSFQEEDKPITVKLSVTDFSITGNNEASAEAAVQFIPSKGIVDASLGYSDENGEVTVQWTPEPETRARLANATDVGASLEAQILGKNDKIISKTTFAPDFNRDREILEAFYRSADGDNWSRHDNWCTDKPLNEWYGIQTDYDSQGRPNRVTSINLDVTGINGTADFRGLAKLEYLYLGHVNERKHITAINVAGLSNLHHLNCRNCDVSTLDISGCNGLTYLMLHDNNLTELDFAGCPNLERLYCMNNQLTHLDFSQTPKMNHLVAGNNPYAGLDVSMLTNLNYLSFGGENMTSAPILSEKNRTITELHCEGGKFAEMDLSMLYNLESLTFTNTEVKRLDLSAVTKLQELLILNTQISTLDLSALREIETIVIRENERLENIVTTDFPKLKTVQCWFNQQLNALDFSGCPEVIEIQVGYNELTSLSTANCPKLERLDCNDNQIRNLNISYCPSLNYINRNNNPIEILNIAGATGMYGDFNDFKLKVVTVSENDYHSRFPGWGEYNEDKYQSPDFKDGWQYPRYIIVP